MAQPALTADLEKAQAELAAAQAAKPEQEVLARQITAVDILLPTYDELEAKTAALHRKERDLQKLASMQEKAEKTGNALAAETAALKQEHKELETVAAQQEKLTAHKQTLLEHKEKFRKLIADIGMLDTQKLALLQSQQAYRKAQTASSRLGQEYDAMNKAFLDNQAGILAGTLAEGEPCPVCGSREHPNLACLSKNAPTEAEVKKAKNAYELAQRETENASRAANLQSGVVAATESKLLQEMHALLEGTPQNMAEAAAREQEKLLSLRLLEIDREMRALGDMAARRDALEFLIPGKEKALADAQNTLTAAREQGAALTAAVAELKQQTAELSGKLAYPDRAAAVSHRTELEHRAAALEAALVSAQDRCNASREALAGLLAAITQLRGQLEQELEGDVAALQARKQEMSDEKEKLGKLQREVHARLSANTAAKKNISRKAQQMEELESRYAWMRALADTANGSLSGKDKIMLETYIQMTFFDRILERANLRLRKMSGGQYDLKRRRSAANKQSQSGLELDIVDHINTTQRSVNTLSGGEAFLASLALALGLSDEVQMSTGIRLDTLFVDEGFGSLDSEALGKAYLTLAGLTEGNRLVGIISHVTELKERIDRQIVVTKDRTGGSHAVIHT